MKKKPKKILQDGPIEPTKIGTSIANHQHKTQIGAHSIFLGQVREDHINEKSVTSIHYSAYEEMAEKELQAIREKAITTYKLSCAHVYHSLGTIKVGEICLFVFTSSPHRQAAIDACTYIVEEIKNKVPIFGKEILDDESYEWKQNNQYQKV